ncbi:ATP-dependent helicase [Humisphaera borealis]|uniref:DNA 3'-5' helicase n=1 Tax=Humisphaera borealis TaxID=2807512 RepID=A0A7M2WSN2_9BACT|nr:ATP-dependent helicase [Humisphaera borealis]
MRASGMDAELPDSLYSKLNDQQRAAATAGDAPLLIVAGAGTGKTNTLAYRVAHLIAKGADPGRILLLTFSRRAAAEMGKRVRSILESASAAQLPHRPVSLLSKLWSGTFHAVGNRLLRLHGQALGIGDSFTVLDRSDAEDLLNSVRSELELDKGDVRFPRKETCLAIYSRCVNATDTVEDVLKNQFPWCSGYPEQLKKLFKAFVARKQEQNTLDYDDLLLYWFHLMQDEELAAGVRARFDHVLVDEYQDTNRLQSGILRKLKPDGVGLTVVGDDAQSIYSFRAATVHNILEFPQHFPGTTVAKLEQNYRSVQPILSATNAVIAECPHRYNKDLFTTKKGGALPRLVTVQDEDKQSDYLIGRILQHVEAGIPLKKQAVLFRTSHHSDALEVELSRRNIPFVKYGGLKFLEAAHVKDTLAILRLAENPKDAISAQRVLQLIDGIGPAVAKKAVQHLSSRHFDLKAWESFSCPSAAWEQWPPFVAMMISLRNDKLPLPDQVAKVREFYAPVLEKRYDNPTVRKRDLEQMEQISAGFTSRSQMLAELTLDPPNSTQDLAGPPLREEDYLILSTIHSAKGCEWDCVYVIHAADGNIPSDMATGTAEDIEEERRLFYVALTRAKDFLEVLFPLKYYAKKHAMGDRHSYAQLTRFLPENVSEKFEKVKVAAPEAVSDTPVRVGQPSEVKRKIAAMFG